MNDTLHEGEIDALINLGLGAVLELSNRPAGRARTLQRLRTEAAWREQHLTRLNADTADTIQRLTTIRAAIQALGEDALERGHADRQAA